MAISESQFVKRSKGELRAYREHTDGTFQDARSKDIMLRARMTKYGEYKSYGIAPLVVCHVKNINKNILVDGLGRQALVERNAADEDRFWVELINVDTEAEAYAIFCVRNNQSSPTKTQLAAAGLIAGDQYTLDIQDSAKNGGFEIGGRASKNSGNKITFGAAEKLYETGWAADIYPLLVDGKATSACVNAIAQFVNKIKAQGGKKQPALSAIRNTPWVYASSGKGTTAYMQDLLIAYK